MDRATMQLRGEIIVQQMKFHWEVRHTVALPHLHAVVTEHDCIFILWHHEIEFIVAFSWKWSFKVRKKLASFATKQTERK